MSVGQCAVPEEPGGAARGHAAEQLVDFDPEQWHERFLAGVRQIGMPARARRPEHGVVVDADDRADPDALAPLQRSEGLVESRRG